MQILKICVFLGTLLWFTGCAQPEYQTGESAYIVWKTPSLRYADQGFIYKSENRIKIEIYSNGQALMYLDIGKDMICTHFLKCTTKKEFNAMMLNPWYPELLLENIFRGEPIFEGEGLKRKRNGFTQNIRNGRKYRIQYSVLNNVTIFHDTINKIQIKVIKQ